MEPIGQIVQKPSMLVPANSLVVSERRKALIEAQITRMAICTHTPKPGPDRMLMLLDDAAIQWRAISDEDLPMAVTLGMKDVGNFMATAAQVAKSWEKANSPKLLELGTGGRQYGPEALKLINDFDAHRNSLTDKEWETEVNKRLEVCREARAKLAGGAA